mgnify:CR=1 FL=1
MLAVQLAVLDVAAGAGAARVLQLVELVKLALMAAFDGLDPYLKLMTLS